MKLILKTLKQVPHEVEVTSGDCTVQELKVQTEKSLRPKRRLLFSMLIKLILLMKDYSIYIHEMLKN